MLSTTTKNIEAILTEAEALNEFEKEETERMENLKQEYLIRSESFNREYSARVFVALEAVNLEFHAIRNAYFHAIRFPWILSCDYPTRNFDDSLELARIVEILTSEPVTSAHENISRAYTPCRIQAEVEQIVMRKLTENVLTV